MLLEPGQMQVWPAILLRMLSSPNDRFWIKKTLLWIDASLRLYTDVFEDLIIFGTILYSLCLLYLFHATLINSYMLNLFNHSIHNSSDAPHFRGLHTFWTNGSFILIIVFLS